jgi:ATP-dependent Lon protease
MIASYLKPLLPLRDIVIFPSMVIPLFVGREKSIKALQEVMKTDKSIVLVTQKNSEIDDPTSKDLYQYGCLSKVLQLLKLPDGTVKVLVEGEKRIKILKHHESSNNYLTCEVEIVEDQNKSKDLEQLALGLIKKFDKLQVLNKKDLNDGSGNLKNLKDPSQIANNICSNLNIQIFEKQELLEIIDLKKRLEKIHQLIEKETSVLSVEKKIRGRVKNQMEKTQREY